jgi:hypothetical protein
MKQVASFLESEARRYGAYLKINDLYLETEVPYNANPHSGFSLVKDYFHSSDMESLQEYYEARMNVNEVPIILAFNESGRSFAFKKNLNDRYNTQETSVVFFENDEGPEYYKKTIVHELLHQFGAIDYYYPKAVTETAKKYLYNSIMGIGQPVVDDFTAYLIGWKDTISANTYWFLKETMWMNAERYEEELRKEWAR